MVSETDGGGVFDRTSLNACGLYLAFSIFVLGRLLIFDFAHSYVGRNTDPSQFMWSLAWWHYAVGHGLNPIITRAIFVPRGANLAWTPTAIPLASFIFWPVTAVYGPVISYNLLALLLPVLAAWTTFILCRHLTKSVGPSILAGYIFGFSPYVLAQILGGHLALVMIFPAPIALYLVARWFEGAISSRATAWLLGFTLGAQFLLAVEIYATATMFAGLALLVALGSTSGETRRRIFRLIGVLAAAYGVSLLIASPYIYCMFAYAKPDGQFWNAKQFSADLLNFFTPTDVNLLGTLRPMRAIARAFPGNLFESSAYVGPGLMVIAVLYARSHWKESLGKTLIDSLLIVCVLSMGPVLQVAGHRLLGMPGALLPVIPLINKALPTRFMVFAFLILAMITAQWFAASETSVRNKYVVAALLVFLSLPNLDSRYWVSKSDTPEFFSRGIYRKYLSPGENVIVTPYSQHGNSMLWQAQSDFYFRMAGGWTGPLPQDYKQWPIVDALTGWTYLPDPRVQLMSFLANYQVGAIVVADGDREGAYFSQWLPAAVAPLDVGGVTLYRIPPEMLVPYRSIPALKAERDANYALFSGVLAAVAKYRTRDLDPTLMTPYALEHLGMFPSDWVGGAKFDKGLLPGKELYRGVWLSYVDTVHLGIGMTGTYEGLKPIINRFAPYAYRIFFPFPQPLVQGAQSPNRNILIIFFTPDGLKRAIAANADPAPAL